MIVGKELIAIFLVFEQPLLLVYVIIAVPALTPLRKPDEVIPATEELLVVQGELEAAVPDPVNVVVLPIQTSAEPVIDGKALIVTESEFEHPLLLV